MKETTIKSEYYYKGTVLNVRKDWVRLEDGRESTRDIVEHSPCVVVIPFEKPNKIHLVRQFRKPIEKELLEACAGIIDDGEDPLVAAKRELQEETGYTAKSWQLLTKAYSSPGFCEEYAYMYLAKDLTPGSTNFDHDEHIALETITLDDIDHMIKTNQIEDTKTILMLLMVKNILKK
ncbi:NUDIX hydrolase [bacterium]|nr:NUDIX hydrolase [bacterium]